MSDKQYVIIVKTGIFFKALYSKETMFSPTYEWNHRIAHLLYMSKKALRFKIR